METFLFITVVSFLLLIIAIKAICFYVNLKWIKKANESENCYKCQSVYYSMNKRLEPEAYCFKYLQSVKCDNGVGIRAMQCVRENGKRFEIPKTW